MNETYCKHCGTFKDSDNLNIQNEHNFRHDFDEVQVLFDSFNGFTIDLTQISFPSFEYPTKCAVENCSGQKLLHGQVIKHEFVPRETKKYQMIKLIIPDDHLCYKCSLPVSEHNNENGKVFDHKFLSKAVVKLLEPFDKENPQFKLKITDVKQNLLDVGLHSTEVALGLHTQRPLACICIGIQEIFS